MHIKVVYLPVKIFPPPTFLKIFFDIQVYNRREIVMDTGDTESLDMSQLSS
jgi:hypothetical protein